MLVALIAKDKPGSQQLRKDTRDAHLQYLRETGTATLAGPLIDGGDMIGSLIVLNVADMEMARIWARNDPYAKAELFDSVELVEWKKVIG